MKLTANNVITILKDCLFKDDEPQDNPILVKGIVSDFGFHPKRIESHKKDIVDMLKQLPKNFKTDEGGGWSFLQACNDINGNQWGEHRSMEALFVLGLAIQKVKLLIPKEMWSALPGGMPYYAILQQE